jgi:dihydroorotate dehydrogenase (NAD+) catalytic subunit
VEEYVRLAAFLESAPGVVGLEVYLATPDEELEGRPFLDRPDRAAEVAGSVARRASVPVFAKLPAMSSGLVETAVACVRAGVHGLTLIDGVPAMGVDAVTMRADLGAATGFLSGPAVRPIALRAVYEVARVLPEVPIFGVGGVARPHDAIEMLLAGAWAVQMGTALLADPASPAAVVKGIGAYLQAKGLRSPGDVRGRIRVPDHSSASWHGEDPA